MALLPGHARTSAVSFIQTWPVFAFAMLAATPLRAEEPQPAAPVELPAVVVPLPEEDRPPTPDSAQRRDPTGAVTTVKARVHDADVRSSSEVLATAPGVQLSDSGGFGQHKVARLRGAGSNGVLVLLDGIPLNGAGGVVDLSRLPSSAIEEYEVIRGGAGARYGSGGLGGVINLKTREASSTTRAVGRLQVGSFETAQGDLTASGPVGGGEALLHLQAGRSKGNYPFLYDPQPNVADNPLVTQLRENNGASQLSLLGRYGRPLSPSTRLDLLAESSLQERGLAGAVPNTSLDAHHSSKLVVASARVVRRVDETETSARAFVRRDAIAYNAGGGFVFPQLDSSAGVEGDLSTLLGQRNGLSAHLSFGSDWLSESSAQNPAWWKGAAMVADEVLLFGGRASVIPSLRVDLVGRFLALSPKLGAQASLPHGFEVKANGGQASRVPSFSELYVQQGSLLPNPQLRPERALFADLSLGHRTGQTFVAVTAFESLYEDLIAYEYHPPFSAKPYNFATARAEGVEAEASASLSDLAEVHVAYTLTFTKNLRDQAAYFGKELPFRPRHRVSARLDAGPERAKAFVAVDHQSSQFHNRSNGSALPARTFVDVGVRSAFFETPKVTVSLELKNLFDVMSQDVDGYPLPGRAAYVTVAVALDSGENRPRGETR